MKREEELLHNREVSEKSIEKYLGKLTREAGGLSLKFSSATQTGYPDRILMFPNGHQIWVEVKGKGERPTRKQESRIRALRNVGQMAAVCDSRESADRIVGLMIRNPEEARRTWGSVKPYPEAQPDTQIFWR